MGMMKSYSTITLVIAVILQLIIIVLKGTQPIFVASSYGLGDQHHDW